MTTHKPTNNKHMIHLEDKLFYGGAKGAVEAFQLLMDLQATLLGRDVGLKVMTKWDGSPAVFIGTDPADGRFFISTKSMLNKQPKVYKGEWELTNAFGGDLLEKLLECWHRLPERKEIIQGDLLFTQGDKSRQMIDGCLYQTFHQNTLVYAAPDSSKLGQQITDARLGIVWHTSYTGPSLDQLTATYGVDPDPMQYMPYLWCPDPVIQFDHIFPAEHTRLTGYLDQIYQLLDDLDPVLMDAIAQTPEAPDLLEWVVNDTIRNTIYRTPWQMVDALQVRYNWEWLEAVGRLKTEKAQQRHTARATMMEMVFGEHNRTQLAQLFEVHRKIQAAKAILINTLNRYQSIDTFVKTSRGYKRTGPEGYVVVGRDGHTCKLVDRMEFSFNNFSAGVQKGWNHPRE